MNKYKEAFCRITDWFHAYTDNNKATPMKPNPHILKILNEEFYNAKMFDCPKCGGVLILFEHQECCHHCGQKLDWSYDETTTNRK